MSLFILLSKGLEPLDFNGFRRSIFKKRGTAVNTAHDGSLSTGHSNSAKGMIGRLETMFLSGTNFPIEAVRGQFAQAIDIFVHLARTADGHRRVMEISEVTGIENGEIRLSEIYKYVPGKGLLHTGAELLRTEKLALSGKCLPGLQQS